MSITNLLPQLPQMPNGDDPYVWRIRRIDADGRTGGWSDWGHFRVVEPAATQTAPAAAALVGRRLVCSPGRQWPAPRATDSSDGGRHHQHRRAGDDPRTVVGASAGHCGRELGVAGHCHRRGGHSLTPSGWRPFTVEDTVSATAGTVISGSGRVGTPLTITSAPAWNMGEP